MHIIIFTRKLIEVDGFTPIKHYGKNRNLARIIEILAKNRNCAEK